MGALLCPECGHRIEPLPAEILRYRGISYRVDSDELRINGQPRQLWRNPRLILAELVRHAERVCTRDHLMTIGGHWGDVYPETLNTEICHARRAIVNSGAQIVTVRSIGYSLREGEWTRPSVNPDKVARGMRKVRSGVPVGIAARQVGIWPGTLARAAAQAGLERG